MKFKVGDKVTGNAYADGIYGYTTSAAIMRVEAVFEEQQKVRVVVVSHKASDIYIGKGDVIAAKALTLVSPRLFTNK